VNRLSLLHIWCRLGADNLRSMVIVDSPDNFTTQLADQLYSGTFSRPKKASDNHVTWSSMAEHLTVDQVVEGTLQWGARHTRGSFEPPKGRAGDPPKGRAGNPPKGRAGDPLCPPHTCGITSLRKRLPTPDVVSAFLC
jgi:hypothetical protein